MLNKRRYINKINLNQSHTAAVVRRWSQCTPAINTPKEELKPEPKTISHQGRHEVLLSFTDLWDHSARTSITIRTINNAQQEII